jgi:hypothetical protein
MSQFADAVARLVIDKDFARATRREPEKIAALYGLSAEEAAKVRELAGAVATDRAAAVAWLVTPTPITTAVCAPGRVLDMPASTPTLLTMPLPGLPSDVTV